jgi:hypothetical protein
MGADRSFIARRAETITKHGHKRRDSMTAEYRTWLGMKRRCTDKRCKDYPNWGGRGIKVCDRWAFSFESFFADMGPRPAEHTIDRINPNGNYEPGNCRWATLQQQGAEHKRSNVAVTVGELAFDNVSAACRHFGVGISAAHWRIQAGIDPAIAVSNTRRMRPRR